MRPFAYSTLILIAAYMVPPPLVGQRPPSVSPEEEPTLQDSIFFGIQIIAILEEKEFPVIHYENDTPFVQVAGKRVPTPPNAVFKWKRAIKHSESFLPVLTLKAEPRSTRFNELSESYIQANMDMDRQATISEMAQSGEDPRMLMGEGAHRYMSAEAMGLVAQDNIAQLEETQREIDRELDESLKQFDALGIVLEMKPEEPLEDCYLFVRVKYREQGTGPEAIQQLGRFFELKDLHPNDRNRHFIEVTGLPEGPIIEETNYFFFSGEKEIPTDFSEQRMLLTEAEAFDFLYADFISNSETSTQSPSLFKSLSRSEALSRVSPDTISKAIVSLEVDPLGEVTVLSVQGVPPSDQAILTSLVSTRKFFPALNTGVPVSEQIEIPFSSLLEHSASR